MRKTRLAFTLETRGEDAFKALRRAVALLHQRLQESTPEERLEAALIGHEIAEQRPAEKKDKAKR